MPSAPTADLGVSVVLPCYNRGAYLVRWLDAFAWWAPYDLPIEVIVVDDGGADHAETVVDRRQGQGIDIRYLRLRAPGGPRNNGQARNAGIRAARFPLVLNSDPDVVFVTDVVRQLIAEWRPGRFCSVSGYFPLTRRASMALWDESERRPLRADDYQRALRGRQNMVHSPDDVHGLHGGFLCDRGTLVEVRGYDERFYCWGWEDRDLLTRLRAGLGLERRYAPGAIVAHQWHPTLRADAGPRRSRVLWQMGWQRACASSLSTITRNPNGWGEWRGDDEPLPGDVDTVIDPRSGTDMFDAYLHEARVWRNEGQPQLAMERIRVALARWWEWSDGEASDLRPLDLQVALAQAAGYAGAGEAALEYARAAADAGDRRSAAVAQQAAADQPETTLAAASLQARWLAEAGQIDQAIDLLERSVGEADESAREAGSPTARQTILGLGALRSPFAAEAIARLCDLLIRIGREDAARSRIDAIVAASREPALDTFECLFFEACQIRLRGGESDRECWPPRVAGADAGDFLFSVAMRARRGDLLFGAIALFDAFLAAARDDDDDGLRARAIELRARTHEQWQRATVSAHSVHVRE